MVTPKQNKTDSPPDKSSPQEQPPPTNTPVLAPDLQPVPPTNSSSFISNPFSVVLKGFSNVFDYNSNVTLILIVISIVLSMFGGIGRLFGGSSSGLDSTSQATLAVGTSSAILLLFAWLASIVVNAMSWLDGIQSAKHKKHNLSEFFQHAMRHFWELLGFYIIYGVIVTVGLIFFIVPGILFLYWYALTPMIILDQNRGIFESMELSKKMIKGMFWEWAALTVVASIFSIGGILSVPSQGGGLGLFYQQIKQLRADNGNKPQTHWSNYLVIVLLIFLILIIIAGIILVAIFAAIKK